MKLWSSIRFALLILPIILFFFYDPPSSSGSVSGPEIAHPAICTGASGDLYWRIRRSVLTHPVICTGASGELSGTPGELYCSYRWTVQQVSLVCNNDWWNEKAVLRRRVSWTQTWEHQKSKQKHADKLSSQISGQTAACAISISRFTRIWCSNYKPVD